MFILFAKWVTEYLKYDMEETFLLQTDMSLSYTSWTYCAQYKLRVYKNM